MLSPKNREKDVTQHTPITLPVTYDSMSITSSLCLIVTSLHFQECIKSKHTLVSSLFILLIFSGDACKWKKLGKIAVAKEELTYTLSYIDLLSYLPTNVDIHRGSLSQAFLHNYKAHYCKTDRSVQFDDLSRHLPDKLRWAGVPATMWSSWSSAFFV